MKLSVTPTAPHSGFVQMYYDVLVDRNIDPVMFKVLMGLMYFCGAKNTTWVGQKRLADTINLSSRIIPKTIRKLESAGYVKVLKRHPFKKTYVYEVDFNKTGARRLKCESLHKVNDETTR